MKNILLIVLLSATAVLSFYMVKRLEHDLTVKEEETIVQEVLVGYNVKARYFDTNNELEYIIDSEKVIDHSKKNGTKFKYPQVNNYNNGLLQWTSTSNKGYMTADRNELTLSEDVVFVDSPNDESPLVVTGSVMYYKALTDTISSNRLSIINDGIVRQQSENFFMNTVTKVIDFDTAIKGRYEAASEP